MCFVLDSIICQRESNTITVETVDTLIVHEYKYDTTKSIDTIIISQVDTFIINEDSPIGEIPVRMKTTTDSLPIMVGTERIYLPIETTITYRGILYKHTIQTIPKLYNVQVKSKQKFITFHKSLAISMDGQKRVLSEIRLGATFGFSRKLTIYGGLSYNSDNEFSPAVGLLVEF